AATAAAAPRAGAPSSAGAAARPEGRAGKGDSGAWDGRALPRGGGGAAMAGPQVWVFFYGSYMNRGVLREVGLEPQRWEAARLDGFDIQVRPRANLVRSDRHSVYGVLATATHAELARLYAHARDVLGEAYLPEAVLAGTADGPA